MYIRPQYALISVSDKVGIDHLAQCLTEYGIQILSTGGTARFLREKGVALQDVSEITEFEEIMDGRVKTLHPRIHGGILARRNHKGDKKIMLDQDIPSIDLVIVNLYPFEEMLKNSAKRTDLIENIDIGGPAMIRASAKNHEFVTVLTDTQDYTALSAELKANNGAVSLEFRQYMAAIAYARTSEYDARIANWMAPKKLPRRFVLGSILQSELRYGENPHQKGAYYAQEPYGFSNANLLQGKPLSYNNINDADAAMALVISFDAPAVAIIKHTIPSGVAIHENMNEAYKRALACDPKSAFGGVVALNRELDAQTAKEIIQIFTEVVIAPKISDAAKEIFTQKPNLRLLEIDYRITALNVRPVSGGILVQEADKDIDDQETFKVVTKRTPNNEEMKDLLFAWNAVRYAKSNAVIFAKDRATIGVGAGQVSRVDAVEQALKKSQEIDPNTAQGSVVASDAFFPFADGVEAIIKAGATAIIQPGGAIRDEDVITACDAADVAMIFTGKRHFRH